MGGYKLYSLNKIEFIWYINDYFWFIILSLKKFSSTQRRMLNGLKNCSYHINYTKND